MKYDQEDRQEREDLIREINQMLRRLDNKRLQRVAWYIVEKWGFGK